MNYRTVRFFTGCLGWLLFFEMLIFYIFTDSLTLRFNYLQFGDQYQQTLQNAATAINNLNQHLQQAEKDIASLTARVGSEEKLTSGIQPPFVKK